MAQIVASDVLAVVLVFGVVTAVLSGEIHLMFLGIGIVEVGRGHLQDLRNGNEEVEQIDDFNTGILFIELLVLGPPFPRHTVRQFGDLLGQRPAVVQHPLLPLLIGHMGRVDADSLVKLFLEAKDLFEFVGCIHKAGRHYRRECGEKSLLFCYRIEVAGLTMKIPDGTVSGSKPLRDPRLTAINFVSDAVNRTLDLKEIADNALDSVLAVMKVDAGSVYIWQDTDQALHLFACRGLSETFVPKIAILQKGTEVIDAVLNGEARVIDDFPVNPRGTGSEAVRAGFESAVLVPIRAHGYVVGVLGLGTYQKRKFDEPDVDLIEAVSNQIGNAMVHAQLQTDLRASEEQYRALVENSDDAIYIADSLGRLRFANNAFSRVFGYRLSDVARTDLMAHVHTEDIDIVWRAVDGLLRGEPIHNLEYRFRRKDGVWIDLQCNGSVFSREGEQVTKVQFVVRDITQARQRHQQLLRRNQQLGALTTLAEVANSSLNIDEIARNTLEVALESTGMSGGAIHLADAKQQALHLYMQSGLPDELVADIRTLKWGEAVPGFVAASGQTVVVDDMTIRTPAAPSPAARHGFRSTIVVPVENERGNTRYARPVKPAGAGIHDRGGGNGHGHGKPAGDCGCQRTAV